MLDPLQMFDVVISMPLVQAIQAGLLTGIMDQAFAKDPSIFRTNPANGLTYQGLRALEDRAIVHTVELLKHDVSTLDDAEGFVHRARLAQHRVLLSHPYKTKFKRPEVQKFYDENGRFLDNRLGLIWGFATELGTRLAAKGQTCMCTNVGVNQEMCDVYALLLKYSLKPEHSDLVTRATANAVAVLSTFGRRYLDHVLSLYEGEPE
ncbi:MAG TPA: hypothetical protein VFN67_34590 [Polyangiales bacterium]|nr:hypothetical protein [Polyangiales bacterium]